MVVLQISKLFESIFNIARNSVCNTYKQAIDDEEKF